MSRNADDIVSSAHASGCVNLVGPLSHEQLTIALVGLTLCHHHVFIVDQSSGPNRAMIACSDTGAKCIERHLEGSW